MCARGVLIAVLAPFLMSCSGSGGPSENAIAREMVSLVGRNAVACGLAGSRKDAVSSWDCAIENERERKAFWFAVGGGGTDSEIWHIIARSEAGERFVLFYTSNNAGHSEFVPHFTKHECGEPFRLFPDERFMLRCGEDVP